MEAGQATLSLASHTHCLIRLALVPLVNYYTYAS